jgi:hypothetical protein
MSGIIFLSENYVNSDITLDTGTANAQFPLSNILNESPAVKFRSLENDVVIIFDLQQTRTIDAIAIHGDTNGTLGVNAASVRTSLTTDFSSSAVTNLSLSASNLIGYAFPDSVSHRYVELTLEGSGSYVELSNIFIGSKTELLQQNLSVGSFQYGSKDLSTDSTNKYGQKFIDVRNKLKFIAGSIEYCLKSEQEELDELFNRHGSSLPLWVIVDVDGVGMNDGEYKLSIYGYLDDMPTWKASGGQTWNTSIKITQAG